MNLRNEFTSFLFQYMDANIRAKANESVESHVTRMLSIFCLPVCAPNGYTALESEG